MASASPARARLLREAGIRFRVIPSRTRETKRGSLLEAVLTNARRKAAWVSRRHPRSRVLAADTMIEFQGGIYGKPASGRAAVDLLCRMAGKTHTLATGVVIRCGDCAIERVVTTRVTFRRVGRKTIEGLVGDSTRFAGGYAIRGGRDPLVARVRGSFTNVVGLPMEIVVPLFDRADAP